MGILENWKKKKGGKKKQTPKHKNLLDALGDL